MRLSSPNKSNKRLEFEHRSFWLFLAKVIPTLTFLIIAILYSRKLSLFNYGQYQSAWMYVNVIAVLLSFGVYQILLATNFRSVVSFMHENSRRFSGFYIILLSLVFLFYITSTQSLSTSLKIIIAVSILIQTGTIFFEAELINRKKEIYVFTVNIFYSIIFFTWHFYLLQSSFDLSLLLNGILILGALRLGLFWKLSRTNNHSAKTIKIPVNHWFFIGVNEFVNIVTKWLDKLVLIYFLQPQEFAIFFNGSIEIPIFGILVSVIGSILLVDISTNIHVKTKVIEIFRNTFLLTSHIVFPLFWFLLIYSNEIFQFIFGGKYNASVEIFMISLLVVPLRVTNYSAILQSYNKGSLVLKGSILDIFSALVLMALLYYLLGVKGAALAIVISTYVQISYYLYQSSIILNTTIFNLIPIIVLLKRFFFSMILLLGLYYFTSTLSISIIIISGAFLTILLVLGGFAFDKKFKFLKPKTQK